MPRGFPRYAVFHVVPGLYLILAQELYEPLWADIYSRMKSAGVSIRSIWIADVANQGASGVLNEYKLGNERN